MVLATAVPKWYCADVRGDNSNETTSTSVVSSNMSEKSCFVDGHLCSSFKFDSYMTTIVSEVLTLFQNLSRLMKKPTICIGVNKDTD